ncbi:hypothetical protein FQN54_009121 [Arachnomyces sp. PD_36]|nr:hypothetical protein FQN54_009121 [Arachnomyces sp. PD_36]
MASISLPQSQSSTLTHLDAPHESFYQNPHLKLAAAPSEPNPPFVFPAAPPPSQRPTSSSSSLKMKDPESPPPLPAFSFNPGAGLPPAAVKPTVPPPPRPGGHRRRGSEFPDAPKSPGLPTTAHTKTDSLVPPPPQLPPPGPGLSAAGPGRRGHAHRRSAAISSMDLTAITRAYPPKPIAGSAPSTPADMKQQHVWHEQNSRPLSRSATSLNATTPPESPNKESEPTPQAKVEFADAVTVIPRPLSVISSETSSSLSTIRPNHSATGSLSSTTGHGASCNKPMARPKSANPAFSFNQNTGFGDNAQLKRPLSASASASPATSTNPGFTEAFDMPPKKKHIWESNSKAGTTKSRLEPLRDSHSPARGRSSPSPNPLTRTQSNRKSGKKQKKVRMWAGAILTRKGRRRSSSKTVSKRAPTPPPYPSHNNSDDDSMSEVDFDEDNTVVLRTPTNPDAPKATLSNLQTNLPNTSLESSWKPKSFYEQGTNADMFSPVIDLDAALGPFNTPDMGCERPVTSSFSAATKRMYSGGRRGEFIGPEMRYHRRAESAPEMPPFDRSSLGMGRFGSNPAIANPDVFYEEEEDAFLADNPSEADGNAASSEMVQSSTENTQTRSSRRDSSATVIAQAMDVQNDVGETAGLGIQVVDSADSYGSGSSGNYDNSSIEQEGPSAPQAGVPPPRPQESVEIYEADDLPSPMGKPPSSTSSPRCTTRFLHVEKRPASSPVDFAYAAAQMPPPLSESSGFPSPDPSNISFEVPRLATASSSMTDRNPSNYSTGCHGSVDDVPSLTSSASTMTNSMPRFSGSFFVRSSGDRAASFSTAVPRRTSQANASKRSSLASLSKLVGGSYGERSKLSHEEKAPDDDSQKSKKKSHRLSRLMQFWKTKEKEKTQAKEEV